MTPNEQLTEWVNGNSIHNDDRDECCPDFSCCMPELKVTEETRKLFLDRPDLRSQMLVDFLTNMLTSKGCSVERSDVL